MKEYSIEALSNQISQSKFPVFICGAGISYGAAPLAQNLEDGLLSSIIKIAHRDKEILNNEQEQNAYEEIRWPYLTLELLVSFIVYRVPLLKPVINRLYKKIFSLEKLNDANVSISKAFSGGAPKIILTSNFDDGLFRALDQDGSDFNLITERNLYGQNPKEGDICAFHGTVYNSVGNNFSPPASMTARELAHPFLPKLSRYIHEVFELADQVYFVGYRGEDFYDLNLLISEYINSAVNEDERLSKTGKFYCIPHMGDLNEVSDFVKETFFENNLISIVGSNENWLISLCEVLSAHNIPRTATKSINTEQIEEQFFSALVTEFPNWPDAHPEISVQCREMLSDINSGLLAAWSVTEHYRLESLGLTSSEIAAFGRPPKQRLFVGIPLAQIEKFQREYWAFNRRFRSKVETDRDIAIETGAELYLEMSHFAMKCVEKIEAELRAIEKSCCLLMAAIAFDYMGLIAMRLNNLRHSNHEIQSKIAMVDSSDQLFEKSWSNAERAGELLKGDEGAKSLQPNKASDYIKHNLSQLIPWKIWSLAPKENYARSLHRSIDEKWELLNAAISERMNYINNEMAGDETSLDFSVSGHAAQCAQRISELLRALAGVNETGIPTFEPSKSFEERELKAAIENLSLASRRCIGVSSEMSSLKNQRLMSAYDALIIAALFRNDTGEAEKTLYEARVYAGSSEKIIERYNQLETRFSSSKTSH